MAHNRKRIRKLSTAVFRGADSEYNFDVFPISTAITDAAAVFIFSRRQVDKFGRWHHSVSCLGETDSLQKEIKKHKRARCIKGSAANVVCVLKENDLRSRSGVVDDISTARTFGCVRGAIKTNIKAKPDVKKPHSAKIVPFTQVKKQAADRVAAAVPAADPGSNNRKPGTKVRRDTPLKSKRTAAEAKPATSRKRISRSVDRDGRQHRLSQPKRTPARRAKTRAARHSRSRAKLAA